jgi:hypothetical protein
MACCVVPSAVPTDAPTNVYPVLHPTVSEIVLSLKGLPLSVTDAVSCMFSSRVSKVVDVYGPSIFNVHAGASGAVSLVSEVISFL